MEDGMRGRPSTARTTSGSQNVGIATGQSGSSKNVYRASSVGLPSDFEFASGEDGLTDTDDGGGFYTSADEDDDGDRILVVPTLPPVGVIGNDVLHTQRQQVVKEDFDTLDVPRKEAQPTVRSESVTINVPPSILDYRTSVYSGARSSITTADTSVKRRKKKWSLSKPLQKIHEWMDLHADTVSVAFLISLTFFGGSALFYICESDQWNYLDALYFMYSLMSTTGYGDVYPVSGWGRTLVVIMVFVGLGLWAYAVSAIGELVCRQDALE
ncbi:voltage-gated potassium channel [Rhizoclosmatium globosum]|uniref:Voltage-gated potassium channel n=1 Tax=Rhizoclosmatium globosum TaxID=329046 RepID=A0A1Y2BNG1_9FUNG|nr:voltage-gated potassium channel [Rhizoclosmatium globosum]|eukprot:ORY36117.1 voltage-gated potassium channel [Rhizoclosmatium globosum]